MSKELEAAIANFVESFRRERDFYKTVSLKAHQICDEIVRASGIRAIVSSRVKKIDRLDDKIKVRAKTKNYSCSDDIRKDIVDLAGVRIALYFPSDIDRVCSLIEASFEIIDKRVFPNSTSRSYQSYEPRFQGYKALHYRCRNKRNVFEIGEEHYSEAAVEIQIASVLMHAWSEVEHDLIYKPVNGDLSEEELSILDELNGLVHTGEIALERLQRAMDVRVAKNNQAFQNQFELASYIHEYYRDFLDKDKRRVNFQIGQVALLFEVIKLIGAFNAEKMQGEILNKEIVNPKLPISDQIILIFFTLEKYNANVVQVLRTGSFRRNITRFYLDEDNGNAAYKTISRIEEKFKEIRNLVTNKIRENIKEEDDSSFAKRPFITFTEIMRSDLINRDLRDRFESCYNFILLLSSIHASVFESDLLQKWHGDFLDLLKDVKADFATKNLGEAS